MVFISRHQCRWTHGDQKLLMHLNIRKRVVKYDTKLPTPNPVKIVSMQMFLFQVFKILFFFFNKLIMNECEESFVFQFDLVLQNKADKLPMKVMLFIFGGIEFALLKL